MKTMISKVSKAISTLCGEQSQISFNQKAKNKKAEFNNKFSIYLVIMQH